MALGTTSARQHGSRRTLTVSGPANCIVSRGSRASAQGEPIPGDAVVMCVTGNRRYCREGKRGRFFALTAPILHPTAAESERLDQTLTFFTISLTIQGIC